MPGLSLVRLYALRLLYLFMFIGLAVMIWPLLLFPAPDVAHMRGVAWALLGAIGLLALLGVRYPVQMLPLLLLELTWKVIWLVGLWLPRWSAGTLTADHRASFVDCTVGVVLCLLVIPWGYVMRHYVREPGDPWRRRTTG